MNCARTGLWGAWVGNYPGLPGFLMHGRLDNMSNRTYLLCGDRSERETISVAPWRDQDAAAVQRSETGGRLSPAVAAER